MDDERICVAFSAPADLDVESREYARETDDDCEHKNLDYLANEDLPQDEISADLGTPPPQKRTAMFEVNYVTLSACARFNENDSNNGVGVISLETDDAKGRRNDVDVVVVADSSASMEWDRKWEMLVQTVNRLAENLGPRDRLGIVTFNSTARRVVGLRLMNPSGRELVARKMTEVVPQHQTDIFLGLGLGVTMLKSRAVSEPHRVSVLLLCTDGDDTVGKLSNVKDDPTKLKDYLRESIEPLVREDADYILHTFGFGIGPRADILAKIALCGDGLYHFAKEPRDIGKAFGMVLASITHIAATDIYLTIEPNARYMLDSVHAGDRIYLGGSQKLNVRIGVLEIGGRCDIVVSFHLLREEEEEEKKKKEADHGCMVFCVNSTFCCVPTFVEANVSRMVSYKDAVNASDDEKRSIAINIERVRVKDAMAEAADVLLESDVDGKKRAHEILRDALTRLRTSHYNSNPYVVTMVNNLQSSIDGIHARREDGSSAYENAARLQESSQALGMQQAASELDPYASQEQISLSQLFTLTE
jgi:hypothetical protein